MNTLIAIPCHDYVNTEFVMSLLQLKSKDQMRYGITVNTLIYDARNMLSESAVKNGYDKVLWLDSDMIVDPDIADRLSADLDEGHDFVSALYFTRRKDQKPVLFEKIWTEDCGDTMIPHADRYLDYPRDSLFRVAGCGFGACMMRTEVLQRVTDAFGAPFMLIDGFGEDISFCARCNMLGIDIWCDSRIKCGHIGTKVFTEDDYK